MESSKAIEIIKPSDLFTRSLSNTNAFYGNALRSFLPLKLYFHHYFPPESGKKRFHSRNAEPAEKMKSSKYGLHMFRKAKKDIYVNMTRRF